MDAIYQVTGVKGGVGKTLVSMIVVHLLAERGHNTTLIETDSGNPDVAETFVNRTTSRSTGIDKFQRNINVETIQVTSVDGSVELANAMQAATGSVVINCPAANHDAIRQFSRQFWRAVRQLDRTVTTLWAINRDYDSVRQLSDYRELTAKLHADGQSTRHRIHVVRNLYYSEDGYFPTYDESRTKQAIEKAGGRTVDLPILALRLRELLYDDRRTIQGILHSASFGDRVELECWLEDVESGLGEIVNEQF